RVFKLAKSWPAMRKLLSALGKSSSAIMYIGLMVLIYIYIFAVLGVKLFEPGYKKTFGKNQPRFNFDGFFNSCLVIFRIICGEWSGPVNDAIKATGSYVSIVFFLSAYIIGNLLVLNLFLAMLLSSLENASIEEDSINN
ncbi:uncharacterized protein TRIADDRAFT_7330, partial [Trichoplax adhaerens]